MSQGCKLLKNHDSVRGADEPFNNRDAKRTKRESKDELTTNTCVRVSEDESKMNTCAESKEEAQGNTSSDEDKERDRKDDRVLESQSGEDNNSGSDSSATSDSDEEEEKTPTATNGLSAYEQLRAERIARNMARLESLGLVVKPNAHQISTSKKPKPQRKSTSLPRMTRNRYPKRSKSHKYKSEKITSTYQGLLWPQKKKKLNLFEGNHDDDCYICDNGGDLVCCDFCSKAYHLQCHIPPLFDVPDGQWMCCECRATQLTKKTRCGECDACLRTDCGRCIFCRDKPKFGGPNLKKQACIEKRCQFRRYAPPATVAPKQIQSTKTKLVRSVVPKQTNGNKRKLVLFEGEHDDDCYRCDYGGDLVCCDYCSKACKAPSSDQTYNSSSTDATKKRDLQTQTGKDDLKRKAESLRCASTTKESNKDVSSRNTQCNNTNNESSTLKGSWVLDLEVADPIKTSYNKTNNVICPIKRSKLDTAAYMARRTTRSHKIETTEEYISKKQMDGSERTADERCHSKGSRVLDLEVAPPIPTQFIKQVGVPRFKKQRKSSSSIRTTLVRKCIMEGCVKYKRPCRMCVRHFNSVKGGQAHRHMQNSLMLKTMQADETKSQNIMTDLDIIKDRDNISKGSMVLELEVAPPRPARTLCSTKEIAKSSSKDQRCVIRGCNKFQRHNRMRTRHFKKMLKSSSR